MNFLQVDRDLVATEIHEHLCAAINHLSDAVILAADSPDYSIQDKTRLLDAIETVAAITRDFSHINSSTLS